jgi:hypothetical protein
MTTPNLITIDGKEIDISNTEGKQEVIYIFVLYWKLLKDVKTQNFEGIKYKNSTTIPSELLGAFLKSDPEMLKIFNTIKDYEKQFEQLSSEIEKDGESIPPFPSTSIFEKIATLTTSFKKYGIDHNLLAEN